ncbi:fimbria/pilus periplasmic chaperone [Escherichia coli]|uniref:fimbria/pilus periplasmic chaperone n=1 Tax=Escherichia coli TaxID=562 RepID=UPI003EB782FD
MPPFIITPPLFRLEAGDDSLRIKTADNLPENKESLFYINVRYSCKENQMMLMLTELTLVFKTRIKCFIAPHT